MLRKRMDHFIISFFHGLSKDNYFIVILLIYLNDKVHAFPTFNNWDSLLLAVYKMVALLCLIP